MHQHECTNDKLYMYHWFGHKSCCPLLGCYKCKYCLYIKAITYMPSLRLPEYSKHKLFTKLVHIKVIIERREWERLMTYWEIGGNKTTGKRIQPATFKSLILKQKPSIIFDKDLFSASVTHVYIFIYQVLLRNNQMNQALLWQMLLMKWGGGGYTGTRLYMERVYMYWGEWTNNM